MDISKLTLETKRKDSTNEHENFSFETPHVSCSLLESPEFVLLSTTHAPTRTTTFSQFLFTSCLEGWLCMSLFIRNITNLVDVL
jgi:hypothetical protein